MVENDSVIVDLNDEDLTIMGALLLLWRASLVRDVQQVGIAHNRLLQSELDGTLGKLSLKLFNAAIAEADGTKNL